MSILSHPFTFYIHKVTQTNHIHILQSPCIKVSAYAYRVTACCSCCSLLLAQWMVCKDYEGVAQLGRRPQL